MVVANSEILPRSFRTAGRKSPKREINGKNERRVKYRLTNVSFSGFSNISHFVCRKADGLKDKSSNNGWPLIVPSLLSLGGVWSLPVFSVLLFSPS